MSIGGNHTMHVLRRNLDCQILLFNNEIYGLTKGQLSPTSPRGLQTVTSSLGSLENPVNPLLFLLAYGAGFVAQGTPDELAFGTSQIAREFIAASGIAPDRISRVGKPASPEPADEAPPG